MKANVVAAGAGRASRWWPFTWVLLLGGSLGAAVAGAGLGLLPWLSAGLVSHWWRALALVALYTLPGLALLRLLWPRDLPLALSTRLALAALVSAALPPLLLLAFESVGLPWGRAATWGYLLLCLAAHVRWWMVDAGSRSGRSAWAPALLSPGLALLAITVAALLVRLYIVRDLPTGLLGDSYHHTLMAQLLVDNRGLFRSWEPYAPLTTFTYHFGFHANAAFVHWVTGLDVVASVLLAGQLMNALAAPAAFALVVAALRGSPWVGVWAALITVFVLTIPAHFVLWGRYTQLTGQVVLVAVVACWAALAGWAADDRRPTTNDRRPEGAAPGPWSFVWFALPWRLLLLSALMTASMLLTHYLVTVFAALFAGSLVLGSALARASWRALGWLALAGVLAAGLALLLAAPWLLNLLSGHLVRNASGFTNGTVEAGRVASYAVLPQVTPLYAKGYVLLAAFGGLLAALWRREWRMGLPAVWAALLVLTVVPQVVGLPGAGAIDNLTGLSALYLALAPLAGYVLALVQGGFATLRPAPAAGGEGRGVLGALGSGLLGLVLVAVVAWGASWQARLIDGSTQLVAHADMAAMAWLRANTPPDALVLVNGFPAYGGTLVAGTDAGWWVPLLAGRKTTLPPLTYGSERGPYDRYWWEVNLLYQDLRGKRLADARPVALDLTTPEALARLREAGVTHVYSGATASPGPAAADWIDTDRLRASPVFRLLYDQGGAEVFQLLPR